MVRGCGGVVGGWGRWLVHVVVEGCVGGLVIEIVAVWVSLHWEGGMVERVVEQDEAGEGVGVRVTLGDWGSCCLCLQQGGGT